LAGGQLVNADADSDRRPAGNDFEQVIPALRLEIRFWALDDDITGVGRISVNLIGVCLLVRESQMERYDGTNAAFWIKELM
jgi:hypothetical protein